MRRHRLALGAVVAALVVPVALASPASALVGPVPVVTLAPTTVLEIGSRFVSIVARGAVTAADAVAGEALTASRLASSVAVYSGLSVVTTAALVELSPFLALPQPEPFGSTQGTFTTSGNVFTYACDMACYDASMTMACWDGTSWTEQVHTGAGQSGLARKLAGWSVSLTCATDGWTATGATKVLVSDGTGGYVYGDDVAGTSHGALTSGQLDWQVSIRCANYAVDTYGQWVDEYGTYNVGTAPAVRFPECGYSTREIEIYTGHSPASAGDLILHWVAPTGSPSPWLVDYPAPDEQNGHPYGWSSPSPTTDPSGSPSSTSNPSPGTTTSVSFFPSPTVTVSPPPLNPPEVIEDPNLQGCAPSGWEFLNPLAYVRGGGCVLSWAFVPPEGAVEAQVQATATRVAGTSAGVTVAGVSSIFDSITGLLPDDGCGTHPVFNIPTGLPGKRVNMSLDALNFCSGLGAQMASVSRNALTVIIGLGFSIWFFEQLLIPWGFLMPWDTAMSMKHIPKEQGELF